MRKKNWYLRARKEELDALAASVNRDFDFDETLPLTPEMRRQNSRARRKRPGRPPVGLGASKLRISMEKGLLKQADTYAKRHGLTRSQLIAQSLRQLLGAA
jgi:hypothetical protein